jgi:hypothetical protein
MLYIQYYQWRVDGGDFIPDFPESRGSTRFLHVVFIMLNL